MTRSRTGAFGVVPGGLDSSGASKALVATLVRGSELTREDAVPVARLFHQRTRTKGEFFSLAGDVADRLAFVEDGILRMFYTTPDGKEHNKRFFRAGDWVLGGLSPGRPTIVSVQALVPCRLQEIAWSVFESATCDSLRWARWTRTRLLAYLDEKQVRENALLSTSALERYGVFRREYSDVDERIPLHHVASYLGITPTQLSRLRRKIRGER
jgi:CRP-like cAMP-binding protein